MWILPKLFSNFYNVQNHGLTLNIFIYRRKTPFKKNTTALVILSFRYYSPHSTTRIFNVAFSPRNQMNMAMRYGLPRITPHINTDVKTTNLFIQFYNGISLSLQNYREFLKFIFTQTEVCLYVPSGNLIKSPSANRCPKLGFYQ